MRFLVIFLVFLIPNFVYAECDFRTVDYKTEMMSPNFIQSINIDVPKSSKFARNQFKILTLKSQNIPDKLKKKFQANITIKYYHGVCRYLGNIRQSGDWKDHISLVESDVLQSLDVKLNTGNVLGATAFKLLIPETRKGNNEILGALVLRELNYIAPETFQVIVNVNGSESLMLFQEKAKKELLERNLRREGPIFEGDESLLWSYKDYNNFELEPLALSRLVNDNWFNKGYTSQKIVVKSFIRLQNAYLKYARSNFLKKNTLFLEINKEDDYHFNDYHRLLLAMGGAHALRPHNRKYYFNAIEDRFEPIYYDGDLVWSTSIDRGNIGYDFLLQAPASPDLIDRVTKLLKSENLKNKYLVRLKEASYQENFYNERINQLISNLKLFERWSISTEDWKLLVGKVDKFWYSTFQKEKKLSQKIIQNVELHKDYANLFVDSKLVDTVTASDLSSILSKNELNGDRVVIIPKPGFSDYSSGYKEFFIGRNVLRTSEGIEIVLDETKKRLELFQKNPTDWVLFIGGDYSNWEIKFNGSTDKVLATIDNQRFNEFGLTGCLTLYQTNIDNTRLEVSGGQCEDSLNLLLVRGVNVNAFISNAFADALDIDFSEIKFSNLDVKNAGNDCFDVSGGDYSVAILKLEDCSDKAISVGEMSTFEAKKIQIIRAGIGISAKDFSDVRVKEFVAINVSECGEAKNKKQEFGGGFLEIENASCKGKFSIDSNSLVDVRNL